MRPVVSLVIGTLALLATSAAFAQSYLAKPQMVGGNAGPAHNYVCPNVDGGPALDCYIDAVRHLYTMCKHVKSIEIIEHGYERSDEGTNTSKSEYCIDKQKGSIARPFQAALREVAISKPAAEGLRNLHEFWLGALAALKWQAGESDEDYKVRTGFIYVDFDERSDVIRETAASARARPAPPAKPVVRQVAREKGSR